MNHPEVTIKVVKLPNFDQSFALPAYQTVGAAGADLQASLGPGEKMVIAPGERVLVPTGLAFEIPEGFEVQIRPRSGLSFKTTLMVVNSPGTIDSDYRGEIKIILGNWGKENQIVEHGDRVAQMLVAPVVRGRLELVTELRGSERGAGGFGSTGKQ
jgi:dUTP pyrophosphatase